MSDVSHVIRYDRLHRGDYYADFRCDKRLKPAVYHCVIQRDDSSEIIAWSQCSSLDLAIKFAKSQLQHLSAPRSKSA